MMQKRVTSGKIFEDSISTKEWIKSPTKPNFKWNGIGRNNFEKIINSKYDPKNFYLLPESTFDKWDLLSVKDSTKTADAKRYKNNKLTSWTLYSEPFFKMATRKDIGKIDKDKYNQFVNEFYQLYYNNGTIESIVNQMTKNSIGIVTMDGFIPIDKIEFRTIVVENAWKGYHRITVQFRIKPNN